MSLNSSIGNFTFGSSTQTMSVIILLLGVSISVAAIFLVAFIWSVKTNQFEDDESPPLRILFDDKPSTKIKSQP